MNESIKQLRLAQSREFNTFCDKILAHEGSYSKPVIQELRRYQRVFTAILGYDEFRELASDDLQRLLVIEFYIQERNAAQA